jgi:hypothetical protein
MNKSKRAAKRTRTVSRVMRGGEVEGQMEMQQGNNAANVNGHSPWLYLDEASTGHVPDPVLESSKGVGVLRRVEYNKLFCWPHAALLVWDVGVAPAS